jgi:long-chain acyl-CoA synthetase
VTLFGLVSLEKQELKKICEEKLAEYLQPVDFAFKDKLPVTAIGKIDFMKLKNEEN